MLLHPALRLPRPRRSLLLAAFLIVAAVAPLTATAEPSNVSADERAEVQARAREMKQIQRDRLRARFRMKLEARQQRGKEQARAAKRAKQGKPALGSSGSSAKPSDESREAGHSDALRARYLEADAALKRQSTLAAPTNVRVNDPTGEAVGICQSEVSIASFGDYVMLGWNDGGSGIGQGIGYSTDGGLTFTDTDPPAIPGGALWFSDPVMTVNPKTGEFLFCALADGPGALSSIAVVKATFTGSTINWGTPVIARTTDGTSKALDKQWLAADSVSGNVYLTYTLFTAFDDSILFQRSTDGGTTWAGPLNISSPSAAGFVQGSRPVVGPDGTVHALWYEIGTIDVDFLRVRSSTNGGASFGAEATAAGFFTNYGTGAPGFNRERGISFPAVAVDHTTGPNRGRLYVTYNESLNFYDDPLGTGGSKTGVENDGFFSRANPFTIGQRLRGTLTATTDLDYFSFPATQGTSYLFYCDSIPRPLYTMRIFCGQDTLTRLAFAGDLNAPAGGQSVMVWTAPTTGTYYLRMAYVTGGLGTGNYRIQTGVAAHGPEPGRDMRDAMIAYSDDGVAWTGPIRVNDDTNRYDNWLPEVAVGADGLPYVAWYDWRDDGCGGRSAVYVSRSNDGGSTWLGNQPTTDALTPWTTVASNLAPNQGDYINIWGDERYVRPAWADGRSGDPDVFTNRIDTYFAMTSCTDDTLVAAGVTSNVAVVIDGSNLNPLFANDYTYSLSSVRNWPMPANGALSGAALGAFGGVLNAVVPDTAAAGVNALTLTVSNASGTQVTTCSMNVTVQGAPVAVADGDVAFALLPSVPNPARGAARIGFSLPRAGDVKLRVYGVRGELVRTLAAGNFAAGQHSVTWDGRDERGNRVAAGAYFTQLEGLGQSATRRMVWMR